MKKWTDKELRQALTRTSARSSGKVRCKECAWAATQIEDGYCFAAHQDAARLTAWRRCNGFHRIGDPLPDRPPWPSELPPRQTLKDIARAELAKTLAANEARELAFEAEAKRRRDAPHPAQAAQAAIERTGLAHLVAKLEPLPDGRIGLQIRAEASPAEAERIRQAAGLTPAC
jgi:hypothetical protein